ncbi:YqhR family membrane protein [Siminovitchia sediminis]|uniref:YqhR family membrane protein n=1 Tax=Siminovitchia sediminis TaxID=1274353 RepID=A0ABW4KIC1_9BACI
MEEKNYYAMPLITMAAVTGFVAGVIGSLMGYLVYYLNFTEISPGIILAPWKGDWKHGWPGILLAVAIYGLVSILPALIYYGTLKKRKSFWWGIFYGVLIFLLVFLVIYPLFPETKSLLAYDFNTILTGICTFILYGVFIGYSISYEYEEFLYLQEVDPKR